MKTRKTPWSERMTYTYHFDNGDRVTLSPGKSTTISASGKVSVSIDEGITEVTIKRLHQRDDAEVRNNLKQITCESPKERERRLAEKKRWAEGHPEYPESENPYANAPRVISLDAHFGDPSFQEDKSRILEDASLSYQEGEEELDDRAISVREYVSTLPATMRQLYDLLYVRGLKQAEVCRLLGLSKSTVSERTKTLESKIRGHFSA